MPSVAEITSPFHGCLTLWGSEQSVSVGTFHQRFVVSQRKRSSPLTAAPLKDVMCFLKGLWEVRAWSLWSGEAGSQNLLPGSQNPLPYPQILCYWFRGLCLHILNSALGFFHGLLFNVRGGWRNCVSDPHCNMYCLPISIVSIYWESCPVLWLLQHSKVYVIYWTRIQSSLT